MRSRHSIIKGLLILALVAIGACTSLDPAGPSGTPTTLPSLTPSATVPPTPSPTTTETPTTAPTATETAIPTATLTATITPTPTSEFPQATVLMQANCRYGPGTAYLYSHGLYAGDRAQVDGRSSSGSWLWLKPENLDRHCWAAASVLEVTGDVTTMPVVSSNLPHATLYNPPDNVQANRESDQVIVSWDAVWMTEDDYRGYLIEANICQNGQLIWVAVSIDGTSYEFTDETSCTGESGGKLYTVEKHGYTDPVDIPWP